MGYKVKLEIFEGPFDLLVYLIENARMDIYDIEVSEITHQYLQYIEKMQEIKIEVGAEFMVLAANLIEIKSKMLLPKINENGEETLSEDPRTDLVERLVEYKKYKKASEIFANMEEAGFSIIEKPQEDISKFLEEPDEILTLDEEQFMKAFNVFINKRKKVKEIKKNYENIQRKKITSEERVNFIRKLFNENPNKTYTFSKTLKDTNDRYDIALSFTSVMEMVKQKQITAEQAVLFGEILLSKGENLKIDENKNYIIK